MAPQSTPSLPTTLRSPPSVSAYTPLTEHETRTPSSFYEGPPVLYYHRVAGRAYLSKENKDKLPWGSSPSTASASGDEAWPVMGDDSVEQVVDIFVGSDPSASCGVALPYPVIGLHAVKSAYTAGNQRVPTIYMQLELSGVDSSDEESETVELTLVPAGTTATDSTVEPEQTVSEASRLFDAISACADLHPDRFGEEEEDDGDGYPSFFREGENGDDYGDDDEYYEEGDEEGDGILVEGGDGATMEPIEGFRGVFRGGDEGGGASVSDLPPPMPGSGGWITADNAHEFFDEDGNWRGRGGSLGEGAGRVRGRDEVETAETEPVEAGAVASEPVASTSVSTSETNGHDEATNGDASESKRLRTE
ncbi:glycosyltransferase family 31 protein [Ophiostoma piceae UAMH 11346]|uniref:Glycosyltransferase family 31 protein n=1 Tax=Ophiostoma piceae (strain UAMH 11346) TaxID=1262450 RepID=S3C1W4_OPHP1|nr:glycosyltransferase family 31 protein [Ophiostoma piceae UAMH 11346]